ncbi:MAG: GNAT family N-acetyltransferase [Acidobacteria bacterium]|nr:GNAT family N-acetyltransferase [Acidobacteriota bacterium]
MSLPPISLSDNLVKLVPLSDGHIEEFGRFCFDESIWTWYPFAIRDQEDLIYYVNEAIQNRKAKKELPFAIIEIASNSAVGCTRFMSIDAKNRRAEIGSTWIDPKWQRTYVNTAAKLLMLRYAFETLKYVRVEFKTDALNLRSRNAIIRIGASEEGILRQHMVTESGRLRDSVYFSILDREWDKVKKDLEEKLGMMSEVRT